MPILHPAVARAKFPALVAKIEAAAVGQHHWRLVGARFPWIQVLVVNARGHAGAGLIIDAENWPHRAIGVTATDPTFHRYARERELPKVPDKDGRSHIYEWGQTRRVWFCLSGTDEYHTNYSAIAAWEWFRHLDTSDPGRVISDCVRMIDVEKLEPLPVAEPDFGDEPDAPPQPPPVPPRPIPGSRRSRRR